jgi:hypothetical protein
MPSAARHPRLVSLPTRKSFIISDRLAACLMSRRELQILRKDIDEDLEGLEEEIQRLVALEIPNSDEQRTEAREGRPQVQ